MEMEIEKAIEYYEKRVAVEKEQATEYEGLGGEFAVSAPLRKSVLERHEAVLSALRAQQEREKGCEYCRRGIISVHMEMKPSSMGNEQLNPNRAPWFCPMCGRRLKEAQEDEN